MPSIHDQPQLIHFTALDGKTYEVLTKVDPNRYLPIHLALMGWMQDVSLDTITNLWWLAQARRNGHIVLAPAARSKLAVEAGVKR